MKLLKYTKKNAAAAKEGQVFLRLFEDDDADPVLYLVDAKGEKIKSGMILLVHNENKFIALRPGLTDKYPLKTDEFDTPVVVHSVKHKAICNSYNFSGSSSGGIMQLLMSDFLNSRKKQDEDEDDSESESDD